MIAAAAAQTTGTQVYVDGVLRMVATFHSYSEGSLPVTLLARRGQGRGNSTGISRPVFHSVSRFDFSGQLRED